MNTWTLSSIIISGLIYIIVFGVEYSSYKSAVKKGYHPCHDWKYYLKLASAPLYVIWGMIEIISLDIYGYICTVREHGGYRRYREWKRQRVIEQEKYAEEREEKRAEYERIEKKYLNGELSRTDLPHVEDGTKCFEFAPEMGIHVNYYDDVREIVYVENEYNERFNKFFQEHKDLRLYHMYKFIYLPYLCKELENGELFHYLFPNANKDNNGKIALTSSYPLQYLVYSEDIVNIEHGMFFFRDDKLNHGAPYIEGDYHPLQEGSDEEIIAQLDAIVKAVHNKHSTGGLYCKAERETIEEGTSEDYADTVFNLEVCDSAVAELIEEVREKIERLKELGLAENILLNLLKEKQKLSRLVITRDFRILLPDYNDMEIKMEPLAKAVFLMFLRHPEGIVFKSLPDYREELTQIYVKLKPYGISDRVLQSIEDVTNPLLNSINEKCARIRGAFIARFDDKLARHYYIYGKRGEPKAISLRRDLVTWE